jgi:hypothetical protein
VSALVRNGFSLQDVGNMTLDQVDLYIAAIGRSNSTGESEPSESLKPDAQGWM